MSESAILPRPRPANAIYLDLLGQRELVSHLLNLVGEYYDTDVRSFVIVGDVVQKIGPDPVPETLWDEVAEQRVKLRLLEAELSEALRS